MNLRLLVLDVDGVLTDNTFVLPPEGDELKAFCAADGLGLRLLQDEGGVDVVLLSGRTSAVVERRAHELRLAGVIQGRSDKAAALADLLEERGVRAAEAAYMGDDLVDLPAMRAVGFSAAPATAREEVRAAATWVAPSAGGRGAVRDLCEYLLKEMGRWDGVRRRYLS